MVLRIGRRTAMAAAFSLTACSAGRSRRPDEMRATYRYDPASGNAILLGSFEVFGAFPNIALSLLSAQPSQNFLTVRRVIETGERVSSSNERENKRTVVGGSHYEEFADKASGLDSSTVLICLVVTAGRYRISEVSLSSGGGPGIVSSRQTVFPALEFAAEPGVARYIGNYVFGFKSEYRIAHMAVRDMSQRDLPRLRSEVPWLASVNPVINVPTAPGVPTALPAEIS